MSLTNEPKLCAHGYLPGYCPDEGCLHRREVRNALLGLAGSMTAADDQARAMTDAELGALLTSGRWSTIEVHEAGRRLLAAGGPPPTGYAKHSKRSDRSPGIFLAPRAPVRHEEGA